MSAHGKRLWLVSAALTLAVRVLGAQSGSPASFVDLRPDGNGLAALRLAITNAFTGVTAAQSIVMIARNTHIDVTFDPELAELKTTLAIRAHERSVAAALLEIADGSRTRMRVSPTGQIIVVAREARPPVSAPRAGERAAVLAPVRTEAARTERRAFQDSPNSLGAVSVTGRELRATPMFIEPDVLRSVQALPGVEARSDYTAGFNVRGGEADQNLILLDGYPIYNPFHLGGLFSTFIDQAVGRVDLRPGSIPAQYGGRLSGLLDVRSADPDSAQLHGSTTISLVSSSASLGRSFGDGSGSWLVAARRTYADAVVDLFKPNAFPYHFQDAQAHVSRAFADGWRVSATVYGGADITKNRDTNVGSGTWGNAVFGATVGRAFAGKPSPFGISVGDSVVVEQRASVTRFDADITIPEVIYRANNSVHDVRVGGSLTAYAARFTTSLGYELARQHLVFQSSSPLRGFGDLIPFDSLRQTERSASAFGTVTYRAGTRAIISVGGRFDDVPSAEWSGVSPRVSMKLFTGSNTALSASAGSYSQWLHSLGREEEPIEPLQYWVGSDGPHQVSLAREATLGAEHWVSPTRLAHVEVFFRRYHDLLVPNVRSDPTVSGDEFNAVNGGAYGVDVLLRQLEGDRFSGWIAYEYAVNTRVGPDGVGYFPPQDRRHNLNLVGTWHTPAATFGARMNFASGYPYTPSIGAYARYRYDPSTHRWYPDAYDSGNQAIQAPFDSARLPWYSRIDVSASRVGHVRGAVVSPYIGVLNVLNAHNPAGYLFDFNGQPKRASFPNLPFVPTFGVTIAY